VPPRRLLRTGAGSAREPVDLRCGPDSSRDLQPSGTEEQTSIAGPKEVTVDLDDPRFEPFLDAFVDMIVEDLLALPPELKR
jgi:hypothetical protein